MRFLNVMLILSVAFEFMNCKQKPTKTKTEQKNNPDINLEIPGSVRLFDGNGLTNWDITNFGPQGEVYISGGKIVLGMGDGCTGITWKNDFPKVNYEVSLEAIRIAGNDFFCGLTFPVNDDFCSFIVGGWAGVVLGLSTIDGLDGSENETTSMMTFNTNEWYKIRLKVTSEKIQAWINGSMAIDFAYEGRQLDIRPEVRLSCPFGITTWKTTGAIRNIYLKEWCNQIKYLHPGLKLLNLKGVL
ncbi:3-keto-disaccharide hydrolase [Saccharicrinis sp. 156]|uniref:3-keto-disaccharide hydrolase n=1 Tax=Saccharicrinis sp. 156 TaxID=3417574 RepID=UPI003D349D0D